ncbi:hypothetical protein Tco_1562425 [Tanacetum coccineum]
METVFYISNCPEKYQVKYASCTLLNSALTWWNSHKRTIRIEAAYAMSWAELMKLMTEVYCLRNEVQKMETEKLVREVDHIKLGDCTTIVTPNTQRAPVGNQLGIVYYEYGRPGHFRKDCPKLRNQNRGNKTGNKNGNKTGN